MRKGTKTADPSRFIGIRWKESIATRFDAIRAKLTESIGFEPDLSDVVRQCALTGLATLEAKHGIVPSPAATAPATPEKTKRKGKASK